MKILLIGFNIQENIFPLGLSYIKGYAEKSLDVDIEVKEFSYGNRFSYGINNNIEQKAMSYILLKKPNVVGFGGYIWSIQIMTNIAKAVKQINPEIKFILGGCEADKNAIDSFDYVIYGEGEIAFKELIEHIKGKREIKDVHNLIYKENREINKTPETFVENLDEIPFPYRQKFEKEYPVVKIETSRGCAFSCKYCHYANVKNREFSIDYLKENIKYLFENYSFPNLTIIDANFNIDKKRMKQILDIIEENNNRGDELYVLFELKPELIDSEAIEILNSYSFKIKAELGLQSTDKEVIENCKRPYDLEKIKNALKLLDNSKIKYKIDLMYGLPKDNFFKFLNSISFIRNNSRQKKIIAHHYMLLNNTAFIDDNIERFCKDYSSMVIKTDTQNSLDFYKTKLFIDFINSGEK